ncbi:hypothetical protein [Flavobacterium sp.]|uniref:hypothetical protein n=1 Tax=Flavobacterium sp. TaxID=239 RepID=UPI002A81EDF6|nr:hypothetical protein [Flavobacterium sp.]
MKNFTYILLLYLIALTALPSVRAVKLQFGNNCEQKCNNSEQKKCENGKFVMSLNFSPLQFINEYSSDLNFELFDFELKKETSFYEIFFNSNYLNSIWDPPKLLL